MALESNHPRVFISHSSTDAWVARQLAREIRACGADTFLDCEQIDHGDDFEERIVDAAENCNELLVLFTPTALDRKYVWLEIGMFFGARKRIVAALYGIEKKDIATDRLTPVMLKRIDCVDLNFVDSYLDQLKHRVEEWKNKNE